MKYGENSAISTHTPAWGVTGAEGITDEMYAISTHTPAWGVTACGQERAEPGKNFNSHARVGRDHYVFQTCLSLTISTHTPAWGVTNPLKWYDDMSEISTHTPAWGVTTHGER